MRFECDLKSTRREPYSNNNKDFIGMTGIAAVALYTCFLVHRHRLGRGNWVPSQTRSRIMRIDVSENGLCVYRSELMRILVTTRVESRESREYVCRVAGSVVRSSNREMRIARERPRGRQPSNGVSHQLARAAEHG